MCLATVLRSKKKKEALAKLPESGYYWKAVRVRSGLYYPCHQRKNTPFDTGNNETKIRYRGLGYCVAFHLYCNKADALNKVGYWVEQRALVRCKVQKKDIVVIGYNVISDFGLTVVTKRFWMPKPKKKPA